MTSPLDASTSLALDDEQMLLEHFEIARKHPWFRHLYVGFGASDYHRVPPVSKSQLLAALDGFHPGREKTGVYLVRSGGSTHAPLVFPVDIAQNNAQRQELARAVQVASIFDKKTLALNIFGYSDLYRTAAILDDLLERCSATTLAMSAHASYQEIRDVASRFSPSHLLGTPSKLSLLAKHLEGKGQKLAIPELVYGGEILRDSTRTLLRKVLGTTQIWSLYGGAETGIWAWSDASARPGLFECLPGVVVEIESPDAGGFGSVVVTNTWRRRFPLFRYRLGDVGRLCIYNGVRYLQLRGRDECSFQFDELTFDLEPFAALTETVADIEMFQFVLDNQEDGRDRIILQLVGNPGVESACKPLGSRVAALLGHGPETTAVSVRRVDSKFIHLAPATSKAPVLFDLRN